jgi:uncharacterized protein YndB with AHSA1/START domain
VITLSSAVEIPAPVEEVFAWLDQPEQLAALNPLPTTIVESRRLPNGGWFVRMLVDDPKGKIEMIGEAVEYEPPTRSVSRGLIKDGHPVTTRRLLFAIDGGTSVRVELEFRVPIRLPFIDKLYERRWRRLTQLALDGTLRRMPASFPGGGRQLRP